MPRSIGAAGCLRGFLRNDAALAELSISCSASFPLFPDHRPKSTSEPLRQFLEHARGFASPEITDPSAEIFRYLMDHLGETYPPRPTRKFPNSLFESHDRFRRQAPLRLLVIREAESQEFPFPWSCHRTLLAVYPKLELRREESRHAPHHSFAGSPTADVNVAVIRISGEPMSASLLRLARTHESVSATAYR